MRATALYKNLSRELRLISKWTWLYKENKQSNKVHVVKHLDISSTYCGSFVFLSSLVYNIFIFKEEVP